MLHVPVGANAFNSTPASWGTARPSATFTTSVTPGTSDFGSWAQLGSDLTADAYGILINISNNYTSSASRNTVCDIGVDESGGTSFTTRIPNLLCGNADTYLSGGRSGSGVWYYFPLFIPAGSAVGARGYSTVVTAFRVGAMFYSEPVNPSLIRKGSFVESLGISTYTGTSITPGTTSESSWVSLGTTTNRCWWWQVGWQIPSADTSHTAGAVHVDVATGDATTKDIMITDLMVQPSAQETITNQPLTAGVEWEVPAGGNIYVRAQFSGTAEASQVAVYGLGG